MASLIAFLTVVLISGITYYLLHRRTSFRDEWRRVPRPNWRCARGGVEYF
jgi:hypothetical protein